MQDRIRFLFSKIREHLWIKPLMICLFSILAAIAARLADEIEFLEIVPEITAESLIILLGIISASMLGISVFAVGSMISAYASASETATPRSFSLVVSDDVSQNALSSFIGAFIFSIVALVALENGIYGIPGRFLLFLITVVVFALIIINFLRWLDRIARLGRLGNTIEKVEAATADALSFRGEKPNMGARPGTQERDGVPVFTSSIGYIQRIDIPSLQARAEHLDVHISIAAQPGTFTAPDRPLAFVQNKKTSDLNADDIDGILEAFVVDKDRAFVEDPRFGLIVLSEIASRALSPAVNDPGTAIDIINTYVRLFTMWSQTEPNRDVIFDRISMPALSVDDLFDDAFNAIARDGSGTIEVAVRLQKALISLARFDPDNFGRGASEHARLAYQYAQKGLQLPEELARLESFARKIGVSD